MITLSSLFLVVILATSLFYLGCAATLTQPIWSRYPPRLDAFMSCPACAGTWYALSVSLALRSLGAPFSTLPWYADAVASALTGTFAVPILFDQLARALRRAGGPDAA